MVLDASKTVLQQPAVQIPYHEQPYELATMLLGLPLAPAFAFGTCVLAMWGTRSGQELLAWSIVAAVLGVWLSALGLLWLGVRGER